MAFTPAVPVTLRKPSAAGTSSPKPLVSRWQLRTGTALGQPRPWRGLAVFCSPTGQAAPRNPPLKCAGAAVRLRAVLDDRDYMRDPEAAERNATKKLIIILIVCFVVQSCFAFFGDKDFQKQLGLSVNGVKHWKVWQFLTFQFLHSVPWPFHVLFNCLGLYFFGKPLEEHLGTTRFLKIYFSSGVAGAVLHILSILALPRHEDIPVVGASAGVCGVMAAFCALFPMRELTTFIYFFPVNIRAIYLLWFLGLFSLYGTIVPFDNVAHGAHLGGLLVGIAWVRWPDQLDKAIAIPKIRLPRRKQQPKPSSVRYEATAPLARAGEKDDASDDFISKEVDPILDKISAHGIHSLTERERKILEKARAVMAKRS